MGKRVGKHVGKRVGNCRADSRGTAPDKINADAFPPRRQTCYPETSATSPTTMFATPGLADGLCRITDDALRPAGLASQGHNGQANSTLPVVSFPDERAHGQNAVAEGSNFAEVSGRTPCNVRTFRPARRFPGNGPGLSLLGGTARPARASGIRSLAMADGRADNLRFPLGSALRSMSGNVSGNVSGCGQTSLWPQISDTFLDVLGATKPGGGETVDEKANSSGRALPAQDAALRQEGLNLLDGRPVPLVRGARGAALGVAARLVPER